MRMLINMDWDGCCGKGGFVYKDAVMNYFGSSTEDENVELREDGSIELREDGTEETRE